MNYLLDTNVISELRQSKRARNTSMLQWMSGKETDNFFISSITLEEIYDGILRVESRENKQATRLRKWFKHDVINAFRGKILSIDEYVALRTSEINIVRTYPENDAYIAATALVHAMPLVTRNVKDFEDIGGLSLVNPFAD
ncbi:PIN domain-containing protein [Mobiluncus porci]|uniref:PIN domain-containing protein n=1 Tax=Mobiluncus porci TaxID=2652278 RepID=UPI0018A6B5C9